MSKKKQLEKIAATFKKAKEITDAVQAAKTPAQKKIARKQLQDFLSSK